MYRFACTLYVRSEDYPSSYIVLHYENMTEMFSSCDNGKFHWKNFDVFNIFVQNIDCGYALEPPRRGKSNEYPQCMFCIRNKKNMYTPAYYIKEGYKSGY